MEELARGPDRPAGPRGPGAGREAESLGGISSEIQRSVLWDMGERYRAQPSSRRSSSGSGPAAAILWFVNAWHNPWEAGAAENESKPLVSRGEASRTEYVGFTKWIPALSMGTAHWSTLVVSVFADVAPYNLMVFSAPVGGLVPMLIGLGIFGGVSVYTAQLVASSMRVTGLGSFGEVWRDTVGRKTAWIPAMSNVFVCFATCTGAAIYCGALFATVMPTTPLRGLFTTPADFWVAMLAIIPALALTLLKDIQSMFWSTIVAGLSALFTVAVVMARAMDGSYSAGGRFSEEMPSIMHPRVEVWELTKRASQPVSALSVTFLMHCNAAKYFRELRPCGRESYSQGVALGVMAGMLTVIAAAVAEQWTFTSRHQNYHPLDDYSAKDGLVNGARIALGLGLTGCLALTFCGLREALVELLTEQLPSGAGLFETVAFQNTLSVVLLATIVFAACCNGGDHEAINAIRSTGGAFVVYVLPCIVFLRVCRRHATSPRLLCLQRALAISVFILGIALVVMNFVVHVDPTFKW